MEQRPPERPASERGRWHDAGWAIDGNWMPPASPAGAPPASQGSSDQPAGRRPGRLAASFAVFVLVAGLVLGVLTAFRLLRAPADTLMPMVPQSAVIYATAYLQPSGSQELALSALADKFPILSDSSKRSHWVESMLDNALQSYGLSSHDVLPWLGTQIGLSVDAQVLNDNGTKSGTDSGGAYAFYVRTTSDAATEAAFQKLRKSRAPNESGISYSVSAQIYRGVTMTSISETFEGGSPVTVPQPISQFTYAILDHVLVMAGSKGYLKTVIDTEQGRDPNLGSSSDYQQVERHLPADRLGLFFLDYPELVRMLETESQALQGSGVNLQPEINLLHAYRGMGVSAAAQSDGLAVDSVVDLDSGELSGDPRAAAGVPADQNAAAGLTPAGAVAFYGFAGTQYLIREVLDEVEQADPSAASFLSRTGLGGFLGTLAGDFGVELDRGSGGTPAAALIVRTTDPGGARRFLDSIIPALVGQTIVPGDQQPAPSLSHVTYSGVAITVYQLPVADTNLAWTVTAGEVILATGATEVEAIIDTMHGKTSLAHTPGYAETAGRQASNAVGFIDMAGLTTLIEQGLSGVPKADFVQNVLPNLRPVRSISMTTSNGTSESSTHILIRVS